MDWFHDCWCQEDYEIWKEDFDALNEQVYQQLLSKPNPYRKAAAET